MKRDENSRHTTLIENNGEDFMSKIGSKGGKAKTDKLKGFAYMKKYEPEKFKKMMEKRKR